MKKYHDAKWLELELKIKTPKKIAKDQNVDWSTISTWIRKHNLNYKIKRTEYKLHCFDCRKMYLSKGRKSCRDGRYRCRTCQSKITNQRSINKFKHKHVYAERYKNKRKDWNFKNKYNITLNDYNNIKKNQKNKCKICNKNEFLVVDHCHTSNRVRGLLCHNCNRALGLFKDNIESLKNAIKYLK